MRIKEQFEKSANSYEVHSRIQLLGAKEIVNELKSPINTIADLGCGSGRLYKELIDNNIAFNKFYGIDFAKNMLSLHPKDSNVELIEGNFNEDKLFKRLEILNIDMIVSASALQWAKDLNFTLNRCAKSAKKGIFFIFSSNTFKNLHKTIGITSPIYRKEEIIEAFNNSYKTIKIEEFNHKLEFNSTIDMLKYIKKSGVSGGLNIEYKKMRYLIDNYPLKYLEFETILLVGESLAKN